MEEKEPKVAGKTRNEKGQWIKGVSGNPTGEGSGRPYSLLTILKEELQKCPEGKDKKTYGYMIVKKMLERATKEGDDQKIKLIWNYIEGMPKQAIDVTTDGNPITSLMGEISDDKEAIVKRTGANEESEDSQVEIKQSILDKE